jgi:hypothetical protein
MTNDENWRRVWQGRSESAVDEDAVERLRRRVLRETSSIKLGLIVPILVTLGVGGHIVWRARTGQAFDVFLAVETWLFIVVVWVVSLWVARGTWRPLADTTAAFVDVSIRRREANLRGATFGAWLYVFQLVFLVLAMARASPAGIAAVLTSNAVIVLGWVGVPTGLAALYWFRRRQQADLERLRELKRQLQSD